MKSPYNAGFLFARRGEGPGAPNSWKLAICTKIARKFCINWRTPNLPKPLDNSSRVWYNIIKIREEIRLWQHYQDQRTRVQVVSGAISPKQPARTLGGLLPHRAWRWKKTLCRRTLTSTTTWKLWLTKSLDIEIKADFESAFIFLNQRLC